jgi:hypothetical protein
LVAGRKAADTAMQLSLACLGSHKLEGRTMKATALLILLAAAVSSCSMDRGRTSEMYPECDQATAEQQRQGKCMHRPEVPDN